MDPDSSSGRRKASRASLTRRSFAELALKMAEVAPTFPPLLVSHGLELSHTLRRTLGERSVEASLWEELLALRRGPGCDAFYATPLAEPSSTGDLLLDRAVETRALVDAFRHNRSQHPGQPLQRVLSKGILRTRRVVVSEDRVPVVVRLGCWFAVVAVGDEHPRALRDRMESALLDSAREVGTFRARRIAAPLLVGIDPVPFPYAIHLHRLGLQGPWMSWSCSEGSRPMGVLAAHHLVLEGPGFAAFRADFRCRVRATRVALGLDPIDAGWDRTEEFGTFDSEPFAAYGGDPGLQVPIGLDDLPPGMDPVEALEALGVLLEESEAELTDRHTFSFDPQKNRLEKSKVPSELALSEPLQLLARTRPLARLPHELRHNLLKTPPSVRYATIQRGAFSLPDFCYAYCRAQHDALAVHHPSYSGQGFTFIVPHRLRMPDGSLRSGVRSTPVLCSFRTRRGAPEGAATFKARFEQRLAEADEGRDLLTRVLDDVLRVAMPRVVKAAIVRVFEHGIGDGGTFLSGRGLVAHIEVPDSVVDPVARYAGIFEGIFGGSCQERGGVALTAVDRGYRRDLSAVGSGIFRLRDPMDLFWQRFAYFLGEAGM